MKNFISFRLMLVGLLALFLVACGNEEDQQTEAPAPTPQQEVTEAAPEPTGDVKTKDVEGFGGVIAKKYEDSQEWWAPEKRPNKDAPNVIIFLLDDVGFAQVGSFGG